MTVDQIVQTSWQRFLMVGALAAGGLCSTFLFTLIIPIQSQLPALLDAPREATAWVVTITVLVSAVLTPLSGRLGDLYGKRRVLLAMVATMAAGSLLSALWPTLLGVLIGRGLQGVMTGVVPLGMAVLRDVLGPRQFGPSVALVSATLGVGGALGLPVSALLTEHVDWRALFWVSAGAGAVLLVVLYLFVPEPPGRAAGTFDWIGALGLSAGITLLLVALANGGAWGWLSWQTLAAFGAGVGVLLLWGVYQLRTPFPVLNLRILARRPVLLTNLASLALGFGLFASNVLFPQMLEMDPDGGVGFGLTLVQASLIVMPSGLVILLLSPLVGRFAVRVGPQPLLVAGAVVLAIAYVFVLFNHSEVWHILATNILVGAGIALSLSSVPMIVLGSVPPSEMGSSNGANTLFRAIGTSSAAAVVGGVLALFAGADGSPLALGFEVSFGLGLGAAVVAFVLAMCVPRRAGT